MILINRSRILDIVAVVLIGLSHWLTWDIFLPVANKQGFDGMWVLLPMMFLSFGSFGYFIWMFGNIKKFVKSKADFFFFIIPLFQLYRAVLETFLDYWDTLDGDIDDI